MIEENYEIPKNNAVCFKKDCTCSFAYTTENENVLLMYCENRSIGSHLWLDVPEFFWASLSPIGQDRHRESVLQGELLIRELKIRDLFKPFH